MRYRFLSRSLLLKWLAALAVAGCGGKGDDSPRPLKVESVSPIGASFVERFEAIATDGNAGDQIYNHWGGNQPRITRHADGTIRVLYLKTSGGLVNWRLMKRAPATASWTEEATGTSTDDVVLVRDPVSDLAHVVAYWQSVPTVYSSPTFTPGTTIPGSWQELPPTSRHYSAVGIGADGTLCYKASRELPTPVPTSNTQTQYICGRHDGLSTWTWEAQQTMSIGLRYAYDYMFPGASGDANRLVATAQSDLYKTAAGYPNSANNYIFNGIRLYSTGAGDTASWSQSELVVPYSAPPSTTSVPTARQKDGFIDSAGRVFSTYFVEPSAGASTPARGHYTVMADSAGNVLFGTRWASVPTFGGTRIFEDGKNRLWLLWTGQGSLFTYVYLYPIIEDPVTHVFSLGAMTDLSTAFWPYSINGMPMLAVPRGGQLIDNVVDATFAASDTVYVSGSPLGPEYPNGKADHQRIFYFRIHLPD
ncbi:hypothetical protein [Archangium sp.]|uniref:hypothetical protein n=1 Tax=Archangium sp. TaxID=1872627 RepID=UPI002ED92047